MKISIFFHTRLSGGSNVDSGVSIDPEWGRVLYRNQMDTLKKSGLVESADFIFIGLNGEGSEIMVEYAPGKANIKCHGNAESLLPTMKELQSSLNQDTLYLFFHGKGATHPHDPMTGAWRDCMMRHCVTNWRKCVADLESGNYDAVGCHWLPNSPHDQNADRWGGNSYFGGVFFWATGKYLMTLPKLPEKVTDRHIWFMPELWVGGNKPRVKDYAPHHPTDCRNHVLHG